MKILPVLVLLALAVVAPSTDAQEPAARTATAPAATDRGSVDGFSGQLMITADPQWQEKWNAPAATTPELKPAHEVHQGGELHVLIYFADPKPGLGDRANVRCDVRVARPDGTYSVSKRDLSCFEGPVTGDAGRLQLAAPTMTFRTEATDPRGEWIVDVTLRDATRGVELPLRATFTVLD